MSEKKYDIKKVIEWLGFILRCPICGVKYSLDNTKVLDSEESDAFAEARILVHSDCNKCKSSVMFNIEVRGPEVFSVGMVTDLTHQDSETFRDLPPISADDVLGIHKAIRKFNGDFVKMFSK